MSVGKSTNYEFTFNWKIKNCLCCLENNGKYIESPIFSPDCLFGTKWSIRLHPRGSSKKNETYISLGLSRLDDQTNEDIIYIEEVWELIGPSGELLKTAKYNNREYKNKSSYGVDILKREIIVNKIIEKDEDILVIKLHLNRKNPQICNATTEISTKCYSFEWNITNPNSTDWSGRKEVKISESLQIVLNISAPEDDILIKINKSNTEVSSPLFMKCKICLMGLKGNKVNCKNAFHLFDSSDLNRTWDFPTFIKKSQLELEKDNIFKNGTFALELHFSCSEGTSSSETDYSISTLQNDLNNMLESKEYCDVQLRSEDVVLPAHKSVLSSRSPIFSTMFKQNMLENNTGIVDIVDIDPDTLTTFIEYLYTDKLDLRDTDTALTLILAAEKYQIITLKIQCSSFLKSNLNVKNVCNVLVTTDMIGRQDLKSSALDYIKDRFKVVVSSPNWPHWIEKNQKLATEVLCHLSEVLFKQFNKSLSENLLEESENQTSTSTLLRHQTTNRGHRIRNALRNQTSTSSYANDWRASDWEPLAVDW